MWKQISTPKFPYNNYCGSLFCFPPALHVCDIFACAGDDHYHTILWHHAACSMFIQLYGGTLLYKVVNHTAPRVPIYMNKLPQKWGHLSLFKGTCWLFEVRVIPLYTCISNVTYNASITFSNLTPFSFLNHLIFLKSIETSHNNNYYASLFYCFFLTPAMPRLLASVRLRARVLPCVWNTLHAVGYVRRF